MCRPYGIWGTLRPFVGAGPRPARGRTLCAPTVEIGPGTLVRKRQAQKHNRTNSNFLPAQAPSGAGRDRTQALLILRAGTVLPASRGNSRKMGSGESGPMDLGGAVVHRPRPRWRFAFFFAMEKEGRRPQAAKYPTHNERNPNPAPPHPAPSGPPSPQGEGFVGEGPSSPQGEGGIKERPAKSPQKNLHLSPRIFPQAVIQCLLKKYW